MSRVRAMHWKWSVLKRDRWNFVQEREKEKRNLEEVRLRKYCINQHEDFRTSFRVAWRDHAFGTDGLPRPPLCIIQNFTEIDILCYSNKLFLLLLLQIDLKQWSASRGFYNLAVGSGKENLLWIRDFYLPTMQVFKS